MKAKIIILEATGKPRIGQICKNTIQMFIWAQAHIDNDVTRGLAEYKMISTFEIYLTDPNAEIKEGDCCIDDNGVFGPYEERDIPIGKFSKIICSTDKALGLTEHGIVNHSTYEQDLIPQLSDQSIKLLIEYYNQNGKMPDEVEVEFEKGFLHCKHCGAPYPYEANDGKCATCRKSGLGVMSKSEIKLNPQGTVDITILEDRLFTKEEMELSFQAGNEFGLYMDEQDNFEVNHNPFRIWIKNL